MTIQVTLSRPTGASAPRIPDGGLSRRGHADGVILNGVIGAVVFDLDGVLIDSEQEWEDARRAVVVRHGGAWRDGAAGAAGAMRGMSSPEWAAYLRDDLGVDLEPGQIVELVVGEVLDRLREDPRVVPGADRVLEELGGRWPLALASSANRVVIDAVLERARWADRFAVTVSAEEVARGKPAPDVYLEAVRRLAEAPGRCAAIEDSTNGLRAALAAGLVVVAVPHADYPPPDELLERADLVLARLGELTAARLARTDVERAERRERRLDEEERESFPASDPHSDWAGPPS